MRKGKYVFSKAGMSRFCRNVFTRVCFLNNLVIKNSVYVLIMRVVFLKIKVKLHFFFFIENAYLFQMKHFRNARIKRPAEKSLCMADVGAVVGRPICPRWEGVLCLLCSFHVTLTSADQSAVMKPIRSPLKFIIFFVHVKWNAPWWYGS